MLLIVVPTKDSFRDLPRLIRSLRHQSQQSWRVLFVDGNSCSDHTDFLDLICHEDPRFTWISQSPSRVGIYGAMNDGIEYFRNSSSDFKWITFWGSDDWASSEYSIQKIYDIDSRLHLSRSYSMKPCHVDLMVFSGNYYSLSHHRHVRKATFGYRSSSLNAEGFPGFVLLNRLVFTLKLFLGFTPPHQAVIFSRTSLTMFALYDESFRLAADLNLFLTISLNHNLSILQTVDDIVSMGDGGISGQRHFLRLAEVFRAYHSRYGILAVIPFISRYIQRCLSSLTFRLS